MHTATTPNRDAATGGVTLRAIRNEAGLTLAQLAERADVDKSTLSRYENGTRAISADLLGRVMQAIADELLRTSGRAA